MRPTVRLLGQILGGLVVVVLLALASVQVFSTNRLAKTFEIADSSPPISRDSASVARGLHLVRAVARCVECHGDDLGGKILVERPSVGRITARNLTSGQGGWGSTLSDAAMVEAIRHGVAPTGRALALMPARGYWYLSDADVAAIVAYVRSVPPVDRDLPLTQYSFQGRLALITGRLDDMFDARSVDHKARREPAPVADTSEAYGRYLARIGGCTWCHGEDLAGKAVPQALPGGPRSSDLTPAGLGSWSEADFFRAMREGVRPDGKAVDTTYMAVRYMREMTDLELRALWKYLCSLPRRQEETTRSQ
jgi:mono/diheme cytochrome c family protein